MEAGAGLKARGPVHSRPGISINKGRTGFFTRLWKDRGKAGTGPGQGPELGEEVFVRSQAGRGDERQEPLRTSHVPEAWMPQGRQRWNPPDSFPLQLIQLLSRLSPLQVEGPRAWRGHPCPRGKSGGRSKRQNLLPQRGERRGVSPSAPGSAFPPGASEKPQREDPSCPGPNLQINGFTPPRVCRQPPTTPLCSWQSSFWSS